MLSIAQRTACFLLLSFSVTGCFNLDFGSSDLDTTGCNSTNPGSVADDLAERYALGATTLLSLSGLQNPQVTSSKPDIIHVSPAEKPSNVVDASPAQEPPVTLSFVGVGQASIRVSEFTDDGALIDAASATVTVAQAQGFQVLLPFYADPVVPLAGKAVIDPEFRVAYFDGDGPLHGRGLAEAEWKREPSGTDDIFFNHALESGPQQVDVEAAHRRSVIHFESVARDEVETLEILETDLGDGRIRVDLVGVTASGTQVWNIDPYFRIDQRLYGGSFEYVFDPDAEPSTLAAGALAFTLDEFDHVETTIHRERPPDAYATHPAAAVPKHGRAPLMALASLLLMTPLVRFGTRRRFV